MKIIKGSSLVGYIKKKVCLVEVPIYVRVQTNGGVIEGFQVTTSLHQGSYLKPLLLAIICFNKE